MYTIAVKRDLVAQHYLVGGDWGKKIKLIPTIIRSNSRWKEKNLINMVF